MKKGTTKKKSPPPSPRFVMIAHKMMCGLTSGSGLKKQHTKERFVNFQERYKTAIVWVDNNMPRQIAGRAISIGVLGAIGKGVLWYGIDKMESFCNALGKGNFAGVNDPAHMLWLWLSGRSKYDCNTAYRKTVACIRAYMLGKQPKYHLHPAETDLFEWGGDFTIMLKRHSNGSQKEFKTYGPDGPSDEEIKLAEEVEEAMASIR